MHDEPHGSNTCRIEELLERLLKGQNEMAIDTKALLKSVADERTILKSWEALAKAQNDTMAKLAQDLADAIAASDPAAIAQVQADLDKAATDLDADNVEAAAAIAAGAPAPKP